MGIDCLEGGTLKEVSKSMGLGNMHTAQQQAYHSLLNQRLAQCPTSPTLVFNDIPKPREGNGMFQNIKNYIEKHRDILFTLGLIILVDHFLFAGALRERIKTSIEGMLKKVEDQFHKPEVSDGK